MILQRYIEAGVVTLVNWPYPPLKGRFWNSVQRAAMNHCLWSFGRFTRWLAMFDVDEYLQLSAENEDRLLQGHQSLPQLLDEAFLGRAAVQLRMWDVSCRAPRNFDEMRGLHRKFLVEICNIDTQASMVCGGRPVDISQLVYL